MKAAGNTPNSTSMKLEGFKQVQKALDELPKELNKDKVWSDINFQASKLIVQRGKLNAPEGPTGHLVDSIGSIRLKRERLGTVWTGPLRRNGKKGFAGHLNEYGTRPRRLKRGGNRGRMKKNPFMSRTFAQSKGTLENDVAKAAAKVIAKVIKRNVKT